MPRPAVLLLTERGAFGCGVSNHCVQAFRGRGSVQIPVSQPGICCADAVFVRVHQSRPVLRCSLVRRWGRIRGWKGDSVLEAAREDERKGVALNEIIIYLYL